MYLSDDGDVFRAAAHAACRPEEVLDFSGNVFPMPLPDAAVEACRLSSAWMGRYPDPDSRRLREAAAEVYGVPVEHVLAGHGATEWLYAVPRALRPRRVVVSAPCYHDYWRAVEHAGGETEGVLAAENDEFVPNLDQLAERLSGVDMAILGNPNNPTGAAHPAESLRALAARRPGTVFVVDETYADVPPPASGVSFLGKPLQTNVLLIRSLSPFYAVPGLRIGFLIGEPDLCARIQRVREPWTVDAAAQGVGEALLRADRPLAALREQVAAERERVRDELSRMAGLRVFHGKANFLLVKITRPSLQASDLCAALLKQRILVRNVSGLRGLGAKFLRISVRGPEDNSRLLAAVQSALESRR